MEMVLRNSLIFLHKFDLTFLEMTNLFTKLLNNNKNRIIEPFKFMFTSALIVLCTMAITQKLKFLNAELSITYRKAISFQDINSRYASAFNNLHICLHKILCLPTNNLPNNRIIKIRVGYSS